MDTSFYLIQALNCVQYGLLLFLVAGGLTLVFGIMGVINLAHGSFYMIGAYLAYWLTGVTGNLFLAILLGIPAALVVGFVVERLAIRYLYERDHLYQVLLTYGLILVFNELQSILWATISMGWRSRRSWQAPSPSPRIKRTPSIVCSSPCCVCSWQRACTG